MPEYEANSDISCGLCGSRCHVSNPEPEGWLAVAEGREWDVGDIYCPQCDANE